MLEITNVEVTGLKESVIACRNSMRTEMPEYTDEEFEKSLIRAKKLARTPDGSGDQTFLSGIRVAFDVKYPCYWTPEAQRYHWFDIITSSSKMHRLLKMDLNKACNKYVSAEMINKLQQDINLYNLIDEKWGTEIFKAQFELRSGEIITCEDKSDALYRAFMICISDCPQGLELFMRVSTNYLQLKTMYKQRCHHKLKEDWQDGFCKNFVEKLPYAEDFILPEKKEE